RPRPPSTTSRGRPVASRSFCGPTAAELFSASAPTRGMYASRTLLSGEQGHGKFLEQRRHGNIAGKYFAGEFIGPGAGRQLEFHVRGRSLTRSASGNCQRRFALHRWDGPGDGKTRRDRDYVIAPNECEDILRLPARGQQGLITAVERVLPVFPQREGLLDH